MIGQRLLLAAVFLLAAVPVAAAEDDCRLHRVASVPMNVDDHGGVFVPMTIAGQDVNLLIDTAGLDSMLTADTVRSLGLPYNYLGGHTASLFGGAVINRFADGHDIVFGGLKTPQMRFLIMPNRMLAPGLGGTLAPDVLRAYDADFDFANGTFNLFSQDHCRGKVVYWTQEPVASVGFEFYSITHVTLPVLLDGQKVTVEMDTGSTRSLFSLEVAERLFGFDLKSPDLKVSDRKAAGADSYQYPFKTLVFGGITVANPDILLVPEAQARMAHGSDHMILGMSVLRHLHIYIAYKERMLYLTGATAH